MRLAICDDEQKDRDAALALAEAYGRKHPELGLECVGFSNGKELLDALAAGDAFSVCLLDVLMPGLTGIDLADRLAELHIRAKIIFLTVSEEYALDAFRVRAQHYLIKPVAKEALFSALDEVMPGVVPSREVPIQVEETEVTVPIDRIAYAECSLHRIRYHLITGKVLTTRTLRVPFQEAVRELSESGRFLQPHRSYLVNVDAVLQMGPNGLVMMDGAVIPISQLRRTEFLHRYMGLVTK